MGKKGVGKKPRRRVRKPPEKPDLPVKHLAAAGEMDHASKSGLDLVYRPLPTNMIWMLQHESRCQLAAVDHRRCSWACESGALRRVLWHDTRWSLQSQIDWYKQHGLENMDLRFGDKFNQISPVDQLSASVTHLTLGDQFNHPVDQLPSSLTHLTFGEGFNHPVDQLPSSLTHLTLGD